MPHHIRTLSLFLLTLAAPCLWAGDGNTRYPLDPQLKVLADDVKNEKYRKLVLETMLGGEKVSGPF